MSLCFDKINSLILLFDIIWKIMGPTQQKPVSKTNNEEIPKIAH